MELVSKAHQFAFELSDMLALRFLIPCGSLLAKAPVVFAMYDLLDSGVMFAKAF
jgi:hypothetical protein